MHTPLFCRKKIKYERTVDIPGGGGGGAAEVKNRESPDFRSPEDGISGFR